MTSTPLQISPSRQPTVDPLFLATPGVSTYDGQRPLSNASAFFFQRDQRLFLVTSRHVLHDPESGHHPDRIQISFHLDPQDLTRCVAHSIWLFAQGSAVWRQGSDSGGDIDVAVVEVDRDALPKGAIVRAFTPDHLVRDFDAVATDATLCIAGFPLGFGDTLHQLPVLRHAAIASPFGIRFQGRGFFLTDARTHRGTSGAAVVMREAAPAPATRDLPWRLLGVHSARMDMGNRDSLLDESLGLNCAWYADILLTLTA